MQAPWDSKQIEFWENGNIKEVYYYRVVRVKSRAARTTIKTALDSVYTAYSSSGKILHSIEFTNNKFDGRYTYFNDSGKPESVFIYRNNKYIGLEKKYYSNGELSQLLTWRKDTLIEAETWDKNGIHVPGTHIENGEGQIVFCNEQGTLCCKCEVHKSKIKHCGPVDSRGKKKKV